MTVPNQNPVSTHVGNGVSTVFAYDFLCVESRDMQVLVDFEVVDPADYTISGIGSQSGGDITFLTPPADGASIIFRLNVVLDRQTSYQQSGDFISGVVNRDFDRLWLSQQSQQVDLDSAVKFPPGEPAPFIPPVAVRARKALVFDDDGNPAVSQDDYDDQAANAAASAQQAADARDSAQAAAASAASYRDAALGAAASAAASAQQAEDALTDMAQFVTVQPAGNITATNVQAALEELDTRATALETGWAGQPIGVPIPVWDHLEGVTLPPTDDPRFRYIKLTAADDYNDGVLINESVSGSAPAVTATAEIADEDSPLHGETVALINTEQAFLRPSTTSGTRVQDTMQGHFHRFRYSGGQRGLETPSGTVDIASSSSLLNANDDRVREIISDGTNGTPRISNQTQPIHRTATAYMRIR